MTFAYPRRCFPKLMQRNGMGGTHNDSQNLPASDQQPNEKNTDIPRLQKKSVIKKADYSSLFQFAKEL